MIQFLTAWNGYEYGDNVDLGTTENNRLISLGIAREFVDPASIKILGYGERIIYNPASAPCLIPTLNGGTATATQSGTLITVNTSVAHNIPSTVVDRISNTGTKVYLNMASGLIANSWYDNIIVTSPTTFTCVSTISQTAGSQTVNPTSFNLVEITPLKFSVASGIAKAFSQIRATFYINCPATSAARGMAWRFVVSGHGNDGARPMSSENTTLTTALNMYTETLVTFLNDVSPHSDFISIDYGGLGHPNTSAKAVAANGDTTFIKPSNGFDIVPGGFAFGSGTTLSDWILFSMARYELLV